MLDLVNLLQARAGRSTAMVELPDPTVDLDWVGLMSISLIPSSKHYIFTEIHSYVFDLSGTEQLTVFRQSGYVGSIHSIFGKNALEHPERICVVETESSATPERSFTYKQIYQASNTLAHHLHDAGITNDDVSILMQVSLPSITLLWYRLRQEAVLIQSSRLLWYGHIVQWI